MENVQKDNIGTSNFDNPTPFLDPSHPFFANIPPPITPSDPNHPLYIPYEENKPTMFEAMNPNIPSIQLGAPISPNP